MSVGLRVRFEDPPKGFLKRRRDPAKVIRELVRAAQAAAATIDPLLGQLISAEEFQSGMEVELVPGIEPLHFEIRDGAAHVDATTSAGGPGYHAYVVGLIEAAAAAIGVSVRVDDPAAEERELFDEGGFLHHHDFALLERVLGTWLHGLAKVLAEGDHWEDVALMWPVDRPRVVTSGIVTPMGPQSRERFVEATQSVEGAYPLGRTLLPWWEQRFGPQTASNLALLLGWSEVRWHVPADDLERRRTEQFVAAVERARALGASPAFAEQELAEARAFLSGGDEARVPSKDGIGYFRRIVRATGTGAWTFDVPGYWYGEWEDDGETATWSFAGVTVRQSSFSADSPLEVPPAPERLPEQRAFFTAEHERMRGWAEVTSVTDEGDPSLRLTAKLVCDNHQCLLTVSFVDSADQGQAEQIFRSVRPPPPAAPTEG